MPGRRADACGQAKDLKVVCGAPVGVLEDVVGELYLLEFAGCFVAVLGFDFVGVGGEGDAAVRLPDFLRGRGLGDAPARVSLRGG